MGVLGMQLNRLIIITHTLNKPFSCVVTARQLTGHINLLTVSLHHNINKGTSLNE